MNVRTRHGLFCSAAVAALWSGSGWAAPLPEQAGVQTTAESPAAAEEADLTSVGDIIVTAQRRSESLQKVPVSITAIEPAQIKALSIQSVDDIQLITPALVYQAGYSYSQTYIRGVGTNLPNPGLESAVATYVDGSYLQRNLGTVSDLFDTGTIQMLKGPQGTLWGRNATGGAILISTSDPTDEQTLRLSGEYGRFNRIVGEAVANVPLTDTVAIRIAARQSHEDGYVTNLFDGSKFGGRTSYTVRGKLRFVPTSDFSAVLGVEYSTRKERGGFTAGRSSAPNCLGCAIPGSGAAPVAGFYDTDNDSNIPFRNRSFNANLKLRYATGPVTIESTTAYRNERQRAAIDQDYTRVPLLLFDEDNGGKTFTQDLQLSTDFDGVFNGLAGVSYLNDRSSISANLSGLAFAALLPIAGSYPSVLNEVDTDSIAAFGELYIVPVENLKLTIGGRYTHDKRMLDSTENLAANLAFAPPGTPLSFSQRASFDSFTPRAVIAYDFGAVNVYASFNRGFKAGGFATPAFGPTNIVRPEKIDSYEAGLKFVSSDRRLRLNLSGFYYKYKDIQVSVVDLAAGGLFTENAARARGYGLEVDGNFAVSSVFSLFGGGTYLNAKYQSYENASVNIPTATGLVSGTADLSGTRLQRAPEFTAFAGANIKAPIGNDWIANLNGVVRYSSSYDFYPGRGGPLGYDYQPSYTVANITGSIGPSDERYSVGFYVDNVTGTHYYIQRGTGQPFGTFDQVAQPRTYGVRVTANF